MKKFFFFLGLFLQITYANGQKQTIDATACATWPQIEDVAISPFGQFVAYQLGSQATGKHLVIQAVEKGWKKVVPPVRKYDFCAADDYLLMAVGNDSIGILRLGSENIQWIIGVADYKMPKQPNTSLLAYRLKSATGELVIQNVSSGRTIVEHGVSEYYFSDNGKAIIALKATKDTSSLALFWYDLVTFAMDSSIIAAKPYGFSFDEKGNQLVYAVDRGPKGKALPELSYLRRGAIAPTLLVGINSAALTGLKIARNSFSFSAQGDRVIFNVEKLSTSPEPTMSADVAKVDVWNYQDREFQSRQQKMMRVRPSYAASVKLDGSSPVRIQLEQDYFLKDVPGRYGDFALAAGAVAGNGTPLAIENAPFYLVNINDGSRIRLNQHYNGSGKLSPTGKYVAAFDRKTGHWYCYATDKHTSKNITASFNEPLTYENDRPTYAAAQGIMGWTPQDEKVLIYGRYDIWAFDPAGKIAPINVTKGLGREQGLRFRYLNLLRSNDITFAVGDTLILSAFNVKTKENGFYHLVLGSNKKPEKIIMSPLAYFYYYPRLAPGISGINYPYLPIKASSVNRFIVRPMSADIYPNLAITDDFRNYKELTFVTPEKDYHWMSVELLHWKQADGTAMEGMLYKPKNLDNAKKYPIIFYFYEHMSDALHNYITPTLSNGGLNIPWFVSNGYLVCVPNIAFKIGYPGPSAYTSVVSAAKHLMKRGYVDATRMGLQGHSFGGYQTNFIITQTNLFAAAVSGAGPSNLLSSYGGLHEETGFSNHFYYERQQGRIGASLWQKPSLFLENSPVIHADKVQTPLLIMHNKGDGAVPFAQGIEWYTALQSLGKKVWMLQYDGENHTLEHPINRKDYSIRLQQYFDHYLKGQPMPVWMSKGVSAKNKGVEAGLELDR